MQAFFVAVAVLAVASQAYSQCIPPCAAPAYPACGCAPLVAPAPAILPAPAVVAPAPVLASPALIQPNSVAATLADTLSLLTVSSLLAEKLPYGCPIIAPAYPGCGCGYGYVY